MKDESVCTPGSRETHFSELSILLYECFAGEYTYTSHVCLVATIVRRGFWIAWDSSYRHCEPLCRYWEPNLDLEGDDLFKKQITLAFCLLMCWDGGLNYVAVAGFKLCSNDPAASASWVAGMSAFKSFKTYIYILYACMYRYERSREHIHAPAFMWRYENKLQE